MCIRDSFGTAFPHTALSSWAIAAGLIALGVAIIVVAVRWRRRGSLGAALRLKELAP